jgi:hypothetical protein
LLMSYISNLLVEMNPQIIAAILRNKEIFEYKGKLYCVDCAARKKTTLVESTLDPDLFCCPKCNQSNRYKRHSGRANRN